MSKYPRTYHLPWSPGCTNDDKIQNNLENILNKRIIISEKMDGSNVCLSKDGVFARSHSKAPEHYSFDFLKSIHNDLKPILENDFPNLQIFGEWCFAKHSIKYTELPSYFLCFGMRDLNLNIWLDWCKTEKICDFFDLNMVPVLYDGIKKIEADLKHTVGLLSAQKSFFGNEREGVVVRLAESFPDSKFSESVLKNVRKNHVQTDVHWKHKQIERNELR